MSRLVAMGGHFPHVERTFANIAAIAAIVVAAAMSAPLHAQDESGDRDGAEIILDEALANNVDPVEALSASLRTDGLTGLRSLWEQVGAGGGIFAELEESADIQFAIFAVDLLGTGDSQTLLRVTDANESDYHFLLLEQAGGGWSSLGSFNLWNQKESTPQHRLEVHDSQRWLIVKSLRGSGSGFERSHESWYEADNGSLKNVLSYPVEGHVSGHSMPFDRKFSGSVSSVTFEDQQPVVSVSLNVTYSNGEVFEIESLDELFTRSETVVYESSESGFVLNEERSTMTEAAVAGIYADDESGFLRHNFTQLKGLATSDEPRREWLRRFLARQDDSTEKSVLLDLLDPESTVITAAEESDEA